MEKYLTVLSFLVVFRGLFILPYVFIMRRTKFAHKGREFLLNRFLGSYDINTWRIFWAALLWLIVFFFSHILTYVNIFLMYIGFESLTI